MARRGYPDYAAPQQEMSAGEFVRTKNDNAYKFVPAPEAEALVEELRSRGLNLDVQPNEPGHEHAAGYYRAQDPDGGHLDVNKRTIFMGKKNPTLYTLAHEQGHALDPNLLREMNMEGFGKHYAGEILNESYMNNDRVGFLNKYLATQGPRSRLRTELEAERYAQQFMVDQGYGDTPYTQDGGGYPFSYLRKGTEQVERNFNQPNVPDQLKREFYKDYYGSAEIFPRGAEFKLKIPIDANKEFDATDEYTRNALELQLDENFQKAKEDELNRGLELAEKVLGDFTEAGKIREGRRGDRGLRSNADTLYKRLRNQY